ncbi:ABC transporter ATP-binding protein [Microbacterium oryzae]|uniref:ABC transporter ATP-binding protein n=1 Tax=Microbacterium oryzae TaxID=743009 RepID=UPI0025AF6ADD|nr:ABC transporter ATP-binding protein [Microbacterium oryzae]MDN3311295.1 ABC transporter ATP-binding protein [Microbacterium oryzae]
MRPALEVSQLSRSFAGRTVLRDVSLQVGAGEVVSIVGPSGSGKSTLLDILTGSLAPDAGAVSFADGGERPFAYMPQRDVLLPWRSILDNAGVGLEVAGLRRREARERAARLFAPFGLAGTERMLPRQLSGGMRQRVSFLRTVVQGKRTLLLDEPFGALDAITRDELQRWLIGMWEGSRWSILLITHDIREAMRMSDRVLVLAASPGRVVGEVAVTRDIPRKEGFLRDARVGELEEHIHQLLRG